MAPAPGQSLTTWAAKHAEPSMMAMFPVPRLQKEGIQGPPTDVPSANKVQMFQLMSYSPAERT